MMTQTLPSSEDLLEMYHFLAQCVMTLTEYYLRWVRQVLWQCSHSWTIFYQSWRPGSVHVCAPNLSLVLSKPVSYPRQLFKNQLGIFKMSHLCDSSMLRDSDWMAFHEASACGFSAQTFLCGEFIAILNGPDRLTRIPVLGRGSVSWGHSAPLPSLSMKPTILESSGQWQCWMVTIKTPAPWMAVHWNAKRHLIPLKHIAYLIPLEYIGAAAYLISSGSSIQCTLNV